MVKPIESADCNPPRTGGTGGSLRTEDINKPHVRFGSKADIPRHSRLCPLSGVKRTLVLGSQIALPPDTTLMADLASTKFTTGTQGGKLVIQAERKEDVVPRLGRSPDRGDAVVMAFTRGQDGAGWRATDPNLHRPKVNRGHENKRHR